MWSVYYFFLKKILNVFQKKWQETRADTRFFFPQKISKMETKYKKASKSLARSFFSFTQWGRKKKLGMDTVEHTASTILVVQIVTKNLKKGLFLFHTGALVVYKPHGYLWVQFCFSFLFFCFFFFLAFLFPHKTGGVCKCASAIWTLSGVGVFWGRVAGIITTWTRSSKWTFYLWSRVLRLDHQPWSGGGKNQGWALFCWTECRAAEP